MSSTATAPRDDARERLARGRVLIVGAGALGCPAALHLASAGVGTLVLMDPDVVELSNLHRQILHRTAGLGMAKVDSVRSALARRFPRTAIEGRHAALNAENATAQLAEVDFAIDATDGAAAKFLINDAAVATARSFSHAGVLGWHGQTTTVVPGATACLRCLFPEPPPADSLPTCQEAGIVGPIAGFIAAVQAGEAIAALLGRAPPLAGRLLTFDGLARRWRHVALARDPHCRFCGQTPQRDGLEAHGAARYGEK